MKTNVKTSMITFKDCNQARDMVQTASEMIPRLLYLEA